MDTKIPSQKGTRINGKGDKKGEERRAWGEGQEEKREEKKNTFPNIAFWYIIHENISMVDMKQKHGALIRIKTISHGRPEWPRPRRCSPLPERTRSRRIHVHDIEMARSISRIHCRIIETLYFSRARHPPRPHPLTTASNHPPCHPLIYSSSPAHKRGPTRLACSRRTPLSSYIHLVLIQLLIFNHSLIYTHWTFIIMPAPVPDRCASDVYRGDKAAAVRSVKYCSGRYCYPSYKSYRIAWKLSSIVTARLHATAVEGGGEGGRGEGMVLLGNIVNHTSRIKDYYDSTCWW